jgi:hypothetical protein
MNHEARFESQRGGRVSGGDTAPTELRSGVGRAGRRSTRAKKILFGLTVVLLLLLGYGVGYWSGSSRARNSVRVVVARDTGDSRQSSGKAGYEPYFTKQNGIPDRVK